MNFLRIAKPDLDRAQARQLLYNVGLGTELHTIRFDLDTKITPYGYPLSASGVIKLKIAYAIASEPKILVFSTLFDVLSRESRAAVLSCVRDKLPNTTCVCFSNQSDLADYDSYMSWDFSNQVHCEDLDEVAEHHRATTPLPPSTATPTPDERRS